MIILDKLLIFYYQQSGSVKIDLNMPYLIDGHNLIGKMPDVSLDDIDDEAFLIDTLENHFRRVRKNAIVFFDRGNIGDSQDNHHSAFLRVRFIRPPQTADQAMIQELFKLKGEARNYTVVSSDRWIIEQAQKTGVKVITSEEFSKILHESYSSPQNHPENHDNDMDFWMNLFESDS